MEQVLEMLQKSLSDLAAKYTDSLNRNKEQALLIDRLQKDIAEAKSANMQLHSEIDILKKKLEEASQNTRDTVREERIREKINEMIKKIEGL